MPPAGYNSDDYGNNGLSAYDDDGNIYLFSIDNKISNSIIHYIIKEDGTLDDNLHGPTSDLITIFDISTNTTLQPELIAWLEAQGFTIPTD